MPKLITTILKEHPDIDIFVSNAGYGDFQSIENFSKSNSKLSKFKPYFAYYFMPFYSKPYYEKNGTIFFIGSESGLVGKKNLYSAAKFGLRGFCQALRDEVATNKGFVLLNFVRTPFFESLNLKQKLT